jgi:hypothetical protein
MLQSPMFLRDRPECEAVDEDLMRIHNNQSRPSLILPHGRSATNNNAGPVESSPLLPDLIQG